MGRSSFATRRPTAAIGFVALLALGACTQAPQQPPIDFDPISSTFGTDVDGWTSAELEAPVWEAPGHIVVVDAGADWQYAIAPAKFHGSWTGAAKLSFQVRADPGPLEYPVRVVVAGAGNTLYVEFPLAELDPGQVSLSAPLSAGQWRRFLSEGSEGPVATSAELAATLAAVTDLRIRLDTTDKFTGDEVNALDGVVVE